MTIEKNKWLAPILTNDEYSISVEKSLDILQHIFDTYELDKEDAEVIEKHLEKYKESAG